MHSTADMEPFPTVGELPEVSVRSATLVHQMGASNQPPTEPPVDGRSVHAGEEPETGWIVRGVVAVHVRPGGAPREQVPPSVAELEAARLVAPDDDPYRYFSPKERVLADWLSAHGITGLRSVRARDRPGKPTPDAVFDHVDGWATLEMKTLDSPAENAVRAGVRSGRKQSPIVVIDGCGVAIPPDRATTALRKAIRVHGVDLRQVIVVLADGSALGWKP